MGKLYAPMILAVGLCLSTAPACAADSETATFNVANGAGFAMAPDHRTLIVATGSAGKLVYIDTAANKEGKHVEVEFQPTALAVQGQHLIAAAKGSGTLHILDWKTGKETATVELPGSAVTALAAHPTKGYVYAANNSGQVFAVDIKTGKGWKTRATGLTLAIDPVDGKSLYTLTQHAIRDRLAMRRVGPQTRFRVQQVGRFALLVKFNVEGKDLALASSNNHAAINGRALAVSPDGKRVAVAGGGGVEDPTTHRRAYDIPVYSSSNLDNMVGQIEVGAYPSNVAFHPVLNIGVAEQGGPQGKLIVFKSKSLVSITTLKPGKTSLGGSYLAFGGNGEKIVFAVPSRGPRASGTTVYVIPLELTAEQKQQLRAAKGGASATLKP